jgi:hypothetical protein
VSEWTNRQNHTTRESIISSRGNTRNNTNPVENSYGNRPYRIVFFSWGGVRLSPLGTSATNWPIVPAQDDRWVSSICWNENWQGKPKYSEKTCHSATLSTTNPTLPDLGSNPGSRVGKPATNRLGYGTAWPYRICNVDCQDKRSVQIECNHLSDAFFMYIVTWSRKAGIAEPE